MPGLLPTNGSISRASEGRRVGFNRFRPELHLTSVSPAGDRPMPLDRLHNLLYVPDLGVAELHSPSLYA